MQLQGTVFGSEGCNVMLMFVRKMKPYLIVNV